MIKNYPFFKACRREKTDFTPLWLMRQAGRYLPEYRKIRQKMSFLKMCRIPEIAVEVTLQPVRRFELDAAILFADILLPLEVIGVKFDITDKEGVQVNPLNKSKEIQALKVSKPEEKLYFVAETIKLLRRELENRIPLIGFSGAPFTLASYLLEGGHSANYLKTKSLIYEEPQTWHLLMTKLSRLVTEYLEMQINAGVQVIQIFDSWVGCLSPLDYEHYVLPYAKRIFTRLGKYKVPLINFATGSAGLLELMRKAGGDIIGIDWRIPLDVAWRRIGYDVGIQGNLDPAVLFAPKNEIRKRVKDILTRAALRPGHIFNLGHGVLPNTPVDNVVALVDFVHELSSRRR